MVQTISFGTAIKLVDADCVDADCVCFVYSGTESGYYCFRLMLTAESTHHRQIGLIGSFNLKYLQATSVWEFQQWLL